MRKIPSDSSLGAALYLFWQQSTQPGCVSFYLCKLQKGQLPDKAFRASRTLTTSGCGRVLSSLFLDLDGEMLLESAQQAGDETLPSSIIAPRCSRCTPLCGCSAPATLLPTLPILNLIGSVSISKATNAADKVLTRSGNSAILTMPIICKDVPISRTKKSRRSHDARQPT